jgi:Domain of unknown function (DUF397)
VSSLFTPPDLPPSARDSLAWRVARDCDAGTCIRVAPHKGMIVIGDTKNPDGPVLSYSHDEWLTFVKGIRQGDFDDLVSGR